MKKILAMLAVVTATAVGGLAYLNTLKPVPVATAVLGEKPGKTMGNQIVSRLPDDLTSKQARLMKMAYDIAKRVGFKNPEIMQSLILQETMAGNLKSYKVANPGPEAYYGIGQIKVAAARDVLKQNPQMWKEYDFHTQTDDEIKANLILNEKFNIEVGARYLKLLQDQYGFTGRKLLNAYNRGPGGVKNVDDSFHYALGAEKKLAQWKTAKR